MKAKILKTPGNVSANKTEIDKSVVEKPINCVHTNHWECDERFSHYTAHVDKTLKEKIKKGEFVDLEKLLPKTKRVNKNNEDGVELVTKNGSLYLLPVGEKESATINSFRRWDKAFQVYAGMYMRSHPHGANEMLQYINTIETAAESFVWSDVYSYDQIFRQAWTMILKEVIPKNVNLNFGGRKNGPGRSPTATEKENIC